MGIVDGCGMSRVMNRNVYLYKSFASNFSSHNASSHCSCHQFRVALNHNLSKISGRERNWYKSGARYNHL